MIIKSMPHKESSLTSFTKLAHYLSSEKSDSRYDLHHHCYGRRPDDIAQEFFDNSQLLSRRSNGNYLYHEIVSISVKKESDREMFKKRLRDISLRYIEARCPRNMVFGCVHEDHEHNLHYHLMVSANERGERTRTRLTKKQFHQLLRDLETHVLTQYPELKQKELINAETQTEKMSVKAGEMYRRTGKLPEREEVKNTLKEAMAQTHSMENFCFFLSERGYGFYTRGKNFGVLVHHENSKSRKYRFSTLGVHDEFEKYQSRVLKSQTSKETHTQRTGDSPRPKRDLPHSQKPPPHTAQESSAVESKAEVPQPSKQEDDMKLRDVLGIREIQKQRAEKQAAKKTAEQTQKTVRHSLQQAKKQIVEEVTKEFHKETENKKQSKSNKHSK